MERVCAAAIGLVSVLAACGDASSDAIDAGADPEAGVDAGAGDARGSDAGEALEPELDWAVTLVEGDGAVVRASTVDGAGNSYVAGWFRGVVTVAGARLESAGGEDGFVAVVDPAGAHLWSRALGGAGDDRAASLTAGSLSRMYVTGSVSGEVDLGGGTIGEPGAPAQVFVASFDAAGAHSWSRVYGPGAGTGIATNATGNLDVSGWLEGTADFGGGALATAGGRDAFVASFEADGAHRWSARFGGAGDESPSAIGNDLSCNVYLTGVSEGDPALGDRCDGAGASAFVASWDQWGAFRWARCLPPASAPRAIAVDGLGHASLAGALEGTLDLGGTDGTVTSAGGRDALVLGLDRDGTLRFAHALGGAADDEAGAVAFDPIGRTYVMGTRAGTEAFVALVDVDAPVTWSLRSTLGGGDSEGLGIAIDGNGFVLVTARTVAGTTLLRMLP